MLYYLLFSLHPRSTVFNVFRYITFRSICAFLTAFAVSLLIGPYIINKLQRNHVGQRIRKDGPDSHLNKSGTPTMGGVIILIAIISSVLLWANFKNRYIWVTLFSVVGFGLIGFFDDYLKFIRNKSDGLAPRYKFGLQILVAMIVGVT
ncbi:MAG: phospho-N-acetylmuramoyl-pentapeptide-transferase, partial [Nitrospirota bacterium]